MSQNPTRLFSENTVLSLVVRDERVYSSQPSLAMRPVTYYIDYDLFITISSTHFGQNISHFFFGVTIMLNHAVFFLFSKENLKLS
jgi:hypothetical protein